MDRHNTTPSGNLVARTATNYDNRGRIYQRVVYAVDPSTGNVGNSLTDNTWYDPSGNVAQEQPAGSGAVQALVRDALGRVTTQYYEYYDGTGDTVMQQIENTFDAASNLIEQITRDRFDNATGYGGLSSPGGAQPQARVSYVCLWPDALGREHNVADYGTNGGSTLTRPTTAPARSATVLVTTLNYNSRGEAYQRTDPAGTVTQLTFDDAGRLTAKVENYVSGGTNPDQNRETDYTYNADGRLATLTAKNGTTGDQLTQYVYGTTLNDSDIASNELLRQVTYPDDASGYDRMLFAYNRLGQMKQKTDQQLSVHTYEYDLLGRLAHDRITTLASGVDGAILRLSYTYEVRGLLQNATSYDNATVGLGNVVNDILLAYNSFAQLVDEYQSHSGAASTSSPGAQYAYANGSANTVRLTSVTYPSGRALNYNYGASGSQGDYLSRVVSLIDNDGVTHLGDYRYAGIARIVQASAAQAGTELTYIKQSTEPVGDGGDQYTGWDRFSRVIDQRWVVTSSYAALERVQYGFTQASNRQWRSNLVAGTGQDEYYTYDGLYRLLTLQRGTLNAGKTGISGTPGFEEDFTLDPTDNWTAYVTKVSGTTVLNQSRTQNKANELLTLSGSSALLGYNANGDLTRSPKPADWTTAYDYTWDAWDRLVKVVDHSTSSVVATYAYDGLDRRVTKTTGTTVRHYYYTDRWQIIEERTGSNTTPDRQFVWGLRSIDDLVLRDRGAERLYAFHDVFNCTAIADTTGTVKERYGYDAYGNPRVMDASFTVISGSNYDWETRYADGRWDGETGLDPMRYRYLHPELGGWLTRDPLEYTPGTNLYAYVGDNPVNRVDVAGLQQGVPSDSLCLGVHLRGDYGCADNPPPCPPTLTLAPPATTPDAGTTPTSTPANNTNPPSLPGIFPDSPVGDGSGISITPDISVHVGFQLKARIGGQRSGPGNITGVIGIVIGNPVSGIANPYSPRGPQ